MFALFAFLVKNPPPPSYGEDVAWFEKINWNGLILLAAILLVGLFFLRRLARRYRRREKDSLELATWAQAGFFKTSRVFRKYGRSFKQGRLSRLAVKIAAPRINRNHAKYEKDLDHFRVHKLHEIMEEDDEKTNP